MYSRAAVLLQSRSAHGAFPYFISTLWRVGPSLYATLAPHQNTNCRQSPQYPRRHVVHGLPCLAILMPSLRPAKLTSMLVWIKGRLPGMIGQLCIATTEAVPAVTSQPDSGSFHIASR